MKSIKNYSLKEFLQQDADLINSYLLYLKYLTPIPTKEELFHTATLKQIDDLKTTQLKDFEILITVLACLQKTTVEEIYKLKILEFYPLLLSLTSQFETILEQEKALIPKHTNKKWEQVGGSKIMSKYGIYNTLDSLAKGDILKWKSIYELPYSEVFTKLLMEKDISDLQHEMTLIK